MYSERISVIVALVISCLITIFILLGVYNFVYQIGYQAAYTDFKDGNIEKSENLKYLISYEKELVDRKYKK